MDMESVLITGASGYPWWAENDKLKKDLGFRCQYTTQMAFRDYAAFVAPGNKKNE